MLYSSRNLFNLGDIRIYVKYRGFIVLCVSIL